MCIVRQLSIVVLTALICAACSPASQDKADGDVAFQVFAAPYTKGVECSITTSLENSNTKLLLSASAKNANGQVVNPSMFMDGDDPDTQQLTKVGGVWKVSGQGLTVPLGTYLDALIFGVGSDDNNSDLSDFGESTWNYTLNASDAASGVVFNNVDTYANQMDVMYASANGISSESPWRTLSLRHAQALLIFNVKFEDKDEWEFIESNGSDYKFKIDDILFLNDAGYTQYLNHNTITPGNVLLKTVGTFSIDNSRNNLEASWSGLDVSADNYSLPMAVTSKSNANSIAEDSPVFSNTRVSWEVNGIVRDKVYQLGQPLLVPEQETQNFIVQYTYNGHTDHEKVNVPKGKWNSGEKYIYTLNMKFNGARFTIDVIDMEEIYGGEI